MIKCPNCKKKITCKGCRKEVKDGLCVDSIKNKYAKHYHIECFLLQIQEMYKIVNIKPDGTIWSTTGKVKVKI